MPYQTILIYCGSERDDAIGENLLKLPFMTALRAAFPCARISWIGGVGPVQFEEALKPLVNGAVDEFITDFYLGQKVSGLFRFGNPMAGRKFDLIIDTQHSPIRTLQLRRIPHGVFVSSAWNWLLSARACPDAALRNSRHLTERMLALLAAASGKTPVLPSPPVLAPEWGEAVRAVLPEGPVYIGIAPGAGNQGRGKVWARERFIKVARAQEEKGRKVVWLIGPQEREWAAELRASLPGAIIPLVDDASGRAASPVFTVALAGRLTAGVANCSGTGHMLALGGAPMVSLFGPTNPAKFAPFTQRRVILRAQDFGGETMEAIPVAAVVEAVNSLIPA